MIIVITDSNYKDINKSCDNDDKNWKKIRVIIILQSLHYQKKTNPKR